MTVNVNIINNKYSKHIHIIYSIFLTQIPLSIMKKSDFILNLLLFDFLILYVMFLGKFKISKLNILKFTSLIPASITDQLNI